MKTINLLYTGKKDLEAAALEATSYDPEKIMIQVFSGTLDEQAISTLQSDLGLLFPKASVIGASSDGELLNARVISSKIVVSISLFENTEVRSCFAEGDDAAKQMADVFGPDARVVFVFGSGMVNGEYKSDLPFLNQLKEKLPKTYIAGGQAGNDLRIDKHTYLFNDKKLLTDGFIGAALYGEELIVKNDFSIGWVPIGKQMTVTETAGNRIISVDGLSIDQIYERYLGINWNSDSFFHVITLFPFIVERDGTLETITPLTKNRDGSFTFISPIETGEKIRFSYYDRTTLLSSLEEMKERMDGFAAESVFIYSCSLRRRILEDYIRFDEIILENLPSTSGFFTFGEYYTDESGCMRSFQQTMTVLMLSESHTVKSPASRKKVEFPLPDRQSRKLLLQKVLINLVASTTAELEKSNRELAELVNSDPMTRLANRRHFSEFMESQIRGHSRTGKPLSLIMMDVDFFKKFNDRYGHVAGDECLKSVAKAISTATKRASDLAFRYGGEEFGCVLPFTDNPGAIQLAERIRNAVLALNIPHKGSEIAERLTISLGVITVSCTSESTTTDLVAACDQLLYKAKNQGRNCTVSEDHFPSVGA